MITSRTADEYYAHFTHNPHCFLERSFIELNQHKVDKVLYLSSESGRIGLVAGVKKGVLTSPFSAPLGGFHVTSLLISPDELEKFLSDLRLFAQESKILSISLTIPPEFLLPTINGKAIHSFIAMGYQMETPDLASSFDVSRFDGTYHSRFIGKNIRHAIREGVRFEETVHVDEMRHCFDIIRDNRHDRGRSIHVTFEEILETAKVIPIRCFKITDRENEIVAASIIYYSGPSFFHVVFWADNEKGRPLRAMNYLVDNLWRLHQEENFQFADIGTSSLDGVPNTGVLHFKESHGCTTSPRFTFTMKIQ